MPVPSFILRNKRLSSVARSYPSPVPSSSYFPSRYASIGNKSLSLSIIRSIVTFSSSVDVPNFPPSFSSSFTSPYSSSSVPVHNNTYVRSSRSFFATFSVSKPRVTVPSSPPKADTENDDTVLNLPSEDEPKISSSTIASSTIASSTIASSTIASSTGYTQFPTPHSSVLYTPSPNPSLPSPRKVSSPLGSPSASASPPTASSSSSSFDRGKKETLFLVYKLAGELATERDTEAKDRPLMLQRCLSMGLPITINSPGQSNRARKRLQKLHAMAAENTSIYRTNSRTSNREPGEEKDRADNGTENDENTTNTVKSSSVRPPSSTDKKTIMTKGIKVIAPLDYSAEGLVILTSNGIIGQYLQNSGNTLRRTYKIRVNQPLPDYALKALSNGAKIPADEDAAKGTRAVVHNHNSNTNASNNSANDNAGEANRTNPVSHEPLPIWQRRKAAAERTLLPMSIHRDTPLPTSDNQSRGITISKDKDSNDKGTKKLKNNLWYTVTTYNNSIKDIRDGFARYRIQISRIIRISYGPFQLAKIPRGGALEIPVPYYVQKEARKFNEQRKVMMNSRSEEESL